MHVVMWRKTAASNCEWSVYKRYSTKRAALNAVEQLSRKWNSSGSRHIDKATYVHHEFKYECVGV